ncbi:MAG: IclR family transcriptional regulator [Propioniciclava sp.]
MNQQIPETGGSHQSVERALLALQCLADGPMRGGELADAVSLGPSTVSRLMLTLERAGFVTREERGGAYSLGPTVLLLGGAAANQSRIHRASRVLVQGLAHEYGVGFNVGIRAGTTMQYMVSLQGGAQVKPITMLGQYSPLHATAMGKALLLGVPADERAELVTPLTAYTVNTVQTMAALADQLEEAATTGYTTEREELALGRACVAAPIRDESGHIVAAVSASGSMRALNLSERLAEWSGIVIEAADAISINLGFQPEKGGAA